MQDQPYHGSLSIPWWDLEYFLCLYIAILSAYVSRLDNNIWSLAHWLTTMLTLLILVARRSYIFEQVPNLSQQRFFLGHRWWKVFCFRFNLNLWFHLAICSSRNPVYGFYHQKQTKCYYEKIYNAHYEGTVPYWSLANCVSVASKKSMPPQ